MLEMFASCKKYLLKHHRMLFGFMVLSLLLGCLSLLTPYLSGKFLDRLNTAENYSFVFYYSLVYMIILFITQIIGYFVSIIYIKLQTKMGYEYNVDVIKHLHRIPLQTIEEFNITYLTQRISGDCNAVVSLCLGIIQNFILNVVKLVIPMVMIFVINIKLGITLLLAYLIYYISYYFLKGEIYNLNFEYLEEQSLYFNKLANQLRFIKFIKVHVMSKEFVKKLNDSFNTLIFAALKLQKISYLFSSLDTIIKSIAQIGLFIFGGISVVNKQLTIGQLTIIMSYFSMAITSGSYFFSLYKTIQESKASLTRNNDLLNIKEELYGDDKISDINVIDIDTVSFSYNNEVYFNYNQCFEKGNIYLIKGSNGSGKSTLVNLLLGLYNNDYNGKIKYNNKSQEEIDLPFLRKNIIRICEQEPTLIEGTVIYNITLSEFVEDYDIERIEKLINCLGFDNLYKLFGNNLNTIINEQNTNISSGEKQKIAILRTLYRELPIMILDEPTSALDEKGKEGLLRYLNKIKKEKLIIIISHDEKIEKFVDKVVDITNNRRIMTYEG